MSTKPISSSPSGGFDVNSVVTGLMAIERQPLDKLNTKVTGYQTKITALGTFKSQVASLQSAAQSLGSASSSSFLAFKATPSDTSVVTASASSTAVAGTYSLDVTSLAQAQKLVAVGQASSTAAIGNGTATTVTFDFGSIDISATNSHGGGTLSNGTYTNADFVSNGSGTHSITIDSTNNTLEGIRDAINTAKIGVTATIVNDGSGTPYRLALSSDATGANQSLKISTSGGDGTINTLLAYDPTAAAGAGQNLTQSAAAQNAVFEVNGISISKTSNTVTDAIQGVTLTLSKELSTATLTVARDTDAVKDKVSGFVKAYNDLYSAMKNSSAYKSKSALEGDATLRSLQSKMHAIADSVVSGGALTKHSDVGLSFQKDGTLSLDSAALDSAMSTRFSDVASLFNSATGYATQFDEWAKDTLASGGAFDTRTTALNASIKSANTQIDSLTLRLDRLQKQYTTQYSSLNVLLSKMGSISAYLTQQLSSKSS
jgi:flagellar hook-associated protein 2